MVTESAFVYGLKSELCIKYFVHNFLENKSHSLGGNIRTVISAYFDLDTKKIIFCATAKAKENLSALIVKTC